MTSTYREKNFIQPKNQTNNNMQKVINFSGGKTSAYMTITEYQKGDLVIFCDTGREHEKTYKFINDFEANENIPIIRISYENENFAFTHLIKKKNYKIIPNRVKRICTVELKIKTQKRYLKSIGIKKFENYIGFRADEERRVLNRKQNFKNVIDKFPLYEKGITKQIINDYWSKKKYNLEIPSILGNCDLCFLKGKNAIISILQSYPELAQKWIDDENRANGRTYFKDITYQQMLNISKYNLFKENLNEITPAFNCSCTS